MSKMIFVNLPVTDLSRSKKFYEQIGLSNNAQFSDDTTACMVLSETISVMLLTHDKWRTFTDRPIPSPSASEVMLAVSCESRDEVDRLNSAASANGGTADANPVQDLGFLYNRSFTDPDGHLWEAVYMDFSAVPAS